MEDLDIWRHLVVEQHGVQLPVHAGTSFWPCLLSGMAGEGSQTSMLRAVRGTSSVKSIAIYCIYVSMETESVTELLWKVLSHDRPPWMS